MSFRCPRCFDQYTQSLAMVYDAGRYQWTNHRGFQGQPNSIITVGVTSTAQEAPGRVSAGPGAGTGVARIRLLCGTCARNGCGNIRSLRPASSDHHHGGTLSTRPVKWSGIVKAMKALHLAEPQISTIRNKLQPTQEVEIGGRAGQRIFQISDFVAAGFEPVAAIRSQDSW